MEAPHRARQSGADEALVGVGIVQPAHLQRHQARLPQLDRLLERALAELTDGQSGRRRPGRPRGSRTGSSSTTPSGTGRRRRRRRGGTRSEQALKLVASNPDITASEIAGQMNIKPNYLYRVLSDLEKEGKVTKDGRKYRAAA